MKEMRLALVLTIIAITLPFAFDAHAESGSVFVGRLSSILTIPTTSADHFKSGLHFAAAGLTGERWSPWLEFDAAWFTLSTVNSGAIPNATQPDFKETHAGSEPFQLRLWTRTPLQWGPVRTLIGLTWYVFDLRSSQSAQVPNAPTVGVIWKKILPQQFSADTTFALGSNPLRGNALLFLSETTLLRKLSETYSVSMSARLPFVRYGGDEGFTAFAPSFLAGFEVKI